MRGVVCVKCYVAAAPLRPLARSPFLPLCVLFIFTNNQTTPSHPLPQPLYSFSTPIHYLTEPVDVFYEWLDACETAKNQQATADPLGAALGRGLGAAPPRSTDGGDKAKSIKLGEADSDTDEEERLLEEGQGLVGRVAPKAVVPEADTVKEREKVGEKRGLPEGLGLSDDSDDSD